MNVREQRGRPDRVHEPADGQPLQPLAARLAQEALVWLREPHPSLLWAVVGVGILLRLGRYLDNRSLWLDESFLAINLLDKSFSELTGPLEFLQTAPVGFLLAQKAVITILGDSEYALRLLPFVSSVAALLVFQGVARRLLPPAAALLALVLFATNSVLLYQASELKPYSSDVAITLVLVALALDAGRRSDLPTWRRLAPLALVAPVAVWFSFPAILVLGAIAVFLGAAALGAGDRRLVGGVAVLCATWLASFGALYAVASTNVSRTTEALFGGGDGHGPGRVSGTVQDAWSTFVNPGGFENGTNGLAVMLFAIGVIALARRRELSLLTLLLLPLAFAAFAALLDKYPLGGRFSIFLVPFLVLLVAAGVTTAVTTSGNPVAAAAALGVFLVAAPVGLAARDLLDPPRREHVQPLLQQLAREWRPSDVLYVYRNAQYALRYYGTCHDCNPSEQSFPWPIRTAPPSPAGEEFAPALESEPPTVIVGAQYREPTESVRDLETLPAGRVWLLFSHPSAPRGLNEESLFRAALDQRGRLVTESVEDGASLYLYELERPPAS